MLVKLALKVCLMLNVKFKAIQYIIITFINYSYYKNNVLLLLIII